MLLSHPSRKMRGLDGTLSSGMDALQEADLSLAYPTNAWRLQGPKGATHRMTPPGVYYCWKDRAIVFDRVWLYAAGILAVRGNCADLESKKFS